MHESGSGLRFTTSDGTSLVYDDQGVGEPIVLVHCYSGNRGYWTFQRQALLDAGYRVIALDQRHHGQSDRPGYGLRMTRFGQDVRELLDLLRLEGATLVGHSFGVSVILAMFSVSGTRRVGKYVAIDQCPRITNDETWALGLRKVEWSNVWESVNFRFDWGNLELEPTRPAHVEAAFPGMDEKFEAFHHQELRPVLLDHFVADWRDVLPRVEIPAWIVTSRFSPFYDLEAMQWMADQFQRGSLSVFEHSGHYPHMNEPDQFNAELLAFLAR